MYYCTLYLYIHRLELLFSWIVFIRFNLLLVEMRYSCSSKGIGGDSANLSIGG
jgi:hypothetical protein